MAAGLSIYQVNHITIISYMQYLAESGFSPMNISNHLAGVRARFIINNIDTTPVTIYTETLSTVWAAAVSTNNLFTV